jgi:hypothetical protein
MDLYICPTCKTKNDESQKYCVSCGTWLLSTSFPAQKISGKTKPGKVIICARCDTANEPERTICKRCLVQLDGTAVKPSGKVGSFFKRLFQGVLVIVLILIAFAVFGGKSGEVKFESVKLGDQFTVSQLVVKTPVTGSPSAAADFTSHVETKNPLEVSLAFYDSSGGRIGKASSMIGSKLTKDQTTTVAFTFEEVPQSKTISSVRLEVVEMSPAMMIERAANKAGEIKSK